MVVGVVAASGNICPGTGERYGLIMLNLGDHIWRQARVDSPRGRAKSFHWENVGRDLIIGTRASGGTLAALSISAKSSSCSRE